ncbi:hypothetical protein Tco_0241674 [Tanacetum coccineum]
MFIDQSHDEVYGCLKGGSGNSRGKRLAISMVEEAWLSKKEEVNKARGPSDTLGSLFGKNLPTLPFTSDSEPRQSLWLVAPPSHPEYIHGLREPPHRLLSSATRMEREPCRTRQQDPDYVPEPIYPKYIPLEDEHEFLAEEQPLPPVDSPTAELPGYVIESDPEEDPKKYEDDEIEDGLVDYLFERGRDEKKMTAIHLWMTLMEYRDRPQTSISLQPEQRLRDLWPTTPPHHT